MADHCRFSPTDTIGFLLACAEAHLTTRPGGVPPIVLVGAEGVTLPYGCCDGILSVESLGEIEWSEDNGPDLVNGCEPCDPVMTNKYRVMVKRCAPSFSQDTSGSPPLPADRNALALALVQETWLFMQAMRCCIINGDLCTCGRVIEAKHTLVSGCQSFWVDIEWEHTPCC
jgi:hypothetical protein